MKLSKEKFLRIFCLTVIVLSLVRCAFPSIAEPNDKKAIAENKNNKDTIDENRVENNAPSMENDSIKDTISTYNTLKLISFLNEKGEFTPHKIYSVSSYDKAFPDLNDVQLKSAKKWGVKPILNREEAEAAKSGLIYAKYSPYYEIKKMTKSIPYLVPSAYVLLQDIGRNFFDSLAIKGLPLHKIVVTSMLRTKEDVVNLRKYNSNASENSCHMYGTTFDISYNTFAPINNSDGTPGRKVRQDSLKWVLSEVINDLRKQNRCYVKYEKKQACFHATIR